MILGKIRCSRIIILRRWCHLLVDGRLSVLRNVISEVPRLFWYGSWLMEWLLHRATIGGTFIVVGSLWICLRRKSLSDDRRSHLRRLNFIISKFLEKLALRGFGHLFVDESFPHLLTAGLEAEPEYYSLVGLCLNGRS